MASSRGRFTPASALPPSPRLARLRVWARLLDSAFVVPGTSIRVGLDPILGLAPGLGDLATPIFAAFVLAEAFRARVPKVVQLRMLLNVAADAVLGAVPVVGDLFDVAWKANARNVVLLERHAGGARRGPSWTDWAFVLAATVALAGSALVPLFVLVWLVGRFGLY